MHRILNNLPTTADQLLDDTESTSLFLAKAPQDPPPNPPFWKDFRARLLRGALSISGILTINEMPGNQLEFPIPKNETMLHERTAEDPSNGTLRYLVVSPYNEKEHLLELSTLNVENQILAEALVAFDCLRDDYATAPYVEAFNWGKVMDRVRELTASRKHFWKETSWYIVAFRSRYEPGIDYGHLEYLDQAAHAEATASGGLLKYWFGSPNHDSRNLATCIWRCREDARRVGIGPAHREAMEAVRSMYAEWKIDQYQLLVRDKAVSWDMISLID